MEKEMTLIGFRAEKEIVDAIDEAAKKHGDSRSTFLRRALSVAIVAAGVKLPDGFEIKKKQGQRSDMKTSHGRAIAHAQLAVARDVRLENDSRRAWLLAQNVGKEGVRFVMETIEDWERENGGAREVEWLKMAKHLVRMARKINVETEEARRLQEDPRPMDEKFAEAAKKRYARVNGRREARALQEKIKSERLESASQENELDSRENGD